MNAHLILLAVAAVVGYGLLALVKPTRRCGRCKGSARGSKRYLGLFGPTGKCRRCKGKRRHPRRGARWVHRFAWLVINEVRDRREDRQSPAGEQ